MKLIDNIVKTIKDKVNKDVDIEYDLSDGYVIMYDEAFGVARKRKKLLKNPRTKTYTYLGVTTCKLLLFVLINIICFMLYKHYGYSSYICMFCVIVSIFYLLLAINLVLFIIRVTVRKGKPKGSFKLSKEGLTDSTFSGIKILFEWSRIKMVVIKKYSIVILTDSPIYFFVNKEVEKKLIQGIKRFKSDIVIVRNDI